VRAKADEQLRSLADRLKKTTPRERLLLAGLAVGALVYAPLWAADYRLKQEERYIDALSLRSDALARAASAKRIALAAADETALRDMETWGFEATNAAVAQVRIEQKLSEAAGEAGLTGVLIATNPEVEPIGPTQWMKAEVQADLRWAAIFAFLDRVATWPEGFNVDGFSYETTPITPLMPFQVQQQNGAPGPEVSGKIRMTLAFPVSLPADEVAASTKRPRS
jgi:type II secretory pathway component PulM